MKPVKLLLEHDRTRPIGKLVSHSVENDKIVATFRIANTMAGEDALIEATEGLRDGFSVGAQINEVFQTFTGKIKVAHFRKKLGMINKIVSFINLSIVNISRFHFLF